MDSTPDITVWIDGGCRNNGTPNAETYFSGLIRGRKDTRFCIDPAPDYATNNQAEYGAAIHVLDLLTKAVGNWKGTIEIRSDSKLMINQVYGNFKVKEPTLKELCDLVNMGLYDLIENHDCWVYFVKVERDEIVAHLGH